MPILERSPRLARTKKPETDTEIRVVPIATDREPTYTTYGDPNGTPVLFLRGTPGCRCIGVLLDSTAWDVGERVLAPDRPGFGRSKPWPDRSVRAAPNGVSD